MQSINNSGSYKASHIDRWEPIKAPLLGRGVTKKDINNHNSQNPRQLYIKPSHYQHKVHIDTLKNTHCDLAILFHFTKPFSCFDLGIGDVVAGTTPVTTSERAVFLFSQVSRQEFGSIWIRPTQLTKSHFINLVSSVGTTFSYLGLKAQFPINFCIQRESNQDSVALAQQVQALVATIKELTRHNKETKLWLQQEENRS